MAAIKSFNGKLLASLPYFHSNPHKHHYVFIRKIERFRLLLSKQERNNRCVRTKTRVHCRLLGVQSSRFPKVRHEVRSS
jgi:hypothetical protein